MKRLSTRLLVVVIVFLLLLAYYNSRPDRVRIANVGTTSVIITSDSSDDTMMLGENGEGTFDRDSAIYIGNAKIKVDERVEIANTGTEEIMILYSDAAGNEKTLNLGPGGTGYLDKSTPFRIGDNHIRISDG